MLAGFVVVAGPELAQQLGQPEAPWRHRGDRLSRALGIHILDPSTERGAGPSLLERAALGELADLAELHADRALEVVVRQRAALLGGEERGAQRGVADVAAREPEPLRQRGEVERALRPGPAAGSATCHSCSRISSSGNGNVTR